MSKQDDIKCCGTPEEGRLDATFWNQQYLNNETGWDLAQVSPPLKAYIDTLTQKDMRILIPGCGNAYEAAWLLQQGFTGVTVVDIAEIPVQRLRQKFVGLPINIIHADFFTLTGSYDLILEQTFFCALNPNLRGRYASKCFNLLATGGKVAGLLFNRQFEQSPPFGGNKEDYIKLFEPLFTLLQFDTCTTSVKPRAGTELFIEMEKKNLPFTALG